jgi:hypothetical protein
LDRWLGRDQVVTHVVRLDFDNDGTQRDRVWSLDDTDQRILLDLDHEKPEPKKD